MALMPAEKQKAYRDRLKKQQREQRDRLAELEALVQQLAQARTRIHQLEDELARERTRRTKVYGGAYLHS